MKLSAISFALLAGSMQLSACPFSNEDGPPGGPSSDAGSRADMTDPPRPEPDLAMVAARDLATPAPDLTTPPAPDLAVEPRPDFSMEPVRDMTNQPVPDLAVKPADLAVKPADLAIKPADLAIKPADLAMKPADLAMMPQDNADRFGVAKLNPTANGGREWFLPADATKSDAEWKPDTVVNQVSPGVFHVSGAPRMMVVSPAGKAWWRNVEMTTYVRETGTVNFYADQEPHWTMFARGARHSNSNIAPGSINSGVAAPQGTVTWPGYPFNGYNTINESCLATCYHALFFPQGKFILEKEITHTEGYTGAKGQITVQNFQHALNRWVGAKFVLRNANGDKAVKLEMWIDRNGDGNWSKITEATDVGAWTVGNNNLNGCTAAPFRYTPTQLVTWAGPWAAFRVDNLAYDFKWMSVREVDPLP